MDQIGEEAEWGSRKQKHSFMATFPPPSTGIREYKHEVGWGQKVAPVCWLYNHHLFAFTEANLNFLINSLRSSLGTSS